MADNSRQAQEVQNLQKTLQNKELELKSKDKELQLLNSTLRHYSECKSELLQKEEVIRNLSLKLSQRMSDARKDGSASRPSNSPLQETLESLANKVE